MSSPIRSISESSTIPDFNVVLFGAAKVGKSALVRRFLKNSFTEEYRPTVEETYSTVLQTMSMFDCISTPLLNVLNSKICCLFLDQFNFVPLKLEETAIWMKIVVDKISEECFK